MNKTVYSTVRTNENKNNVKGSDTMKSIKKIHIIVLAAFVPVGAALCALILRDGLVSIPEAALALAYLAAVRIAGMLARRSAEKTPAEKDPALPAALRPLPGGRKDPRRPAA